MKIEILRYSEKINSIKIYIKFLQRLFHGKIKKKNILILDTQKFDLTSLPLLLAWPGLLQVEMTKCLVASESKKFNDKINVLNKMLDGGVCTSELIQYIDEIVPNGTKTEFINTLSLLYHPDSMSRDFDIQMLNFEHYFANYTIFCFLISHFCRKRPKDLFLTYKDIKILLIEGGLPDHPKIQNLTMTWLNVFLKQINQELFYYRDIRKKKICPLIVGDSIYPDLKMNFNEYYFGNRNYFATVHKYNEKSHKFMQPPIGAKNISFGRNLKYNLWFMRFSEETEKFFPKNHGFLFKNKHKKTEISVDLLVNGLNSIALDCASNMYSFINSCEDFWDKPKDMFLSNPKKFQSLVSSILQNKKLRHPFFEAKKYSRMVGDISNEIGDPVGRQQGEEPKKIAERISKGYVKAKSYYVSSEIRKKLLEAHEELKKLLKHINQKLKAGELFLGDPDKLYEYFTEIKGEYENLQLLDRSGFELITFGGEGNVPRANTQDVLSRIYQELTGLDYGSKSALIKVIDIDNKGKGESYFKVLKS